MWRSAAVVLVTALGLVIPGAPMSAAETAAIDWQPCAIENATATQEFECGRLEVPVDRAQPAGPSFSLALVRHRSTGSPEQRIGSLLFNPGGPGGSGIEALPYTWAMLPVRVRQRFDLVSWDPRGIGRTTPAPVPCSAAPSEGVAVQAGPIAWEAVASQLDSLIGTAHAACQSANADLVAHLGTAETVADLDAIRAALGDTTLTYWGTSYGTAIGYAYAVAHPDRVRAILLDSPVDPSPFAAQRLVEFAQARTEADAVFAAFYPESARQFRAVLAVLDRRPVPLLRGAVLDRWTAIALLEQFTPFQFGYPRARSLVDSLHAAVFGPRYARTVARARLTAMIDEIEATGGDSWWVPSAIWCADNAAWPTPPQVAGLARTVESNESSQVAMQTLGIASMCSGYTFPADPLPTLTSGAGPRVPVLVVGSSHDGRTNGDWIPRMTGAFPGARSITYAGGQHAIYRTLGTTCVDRPTTTFLLTGRLPAQDLTCPNTYSVGTLVP